MTPPPQSPPEGRAVGGVAVRDERDDERAAVRELTLRAYAEYATTMTPVAWAELEWALHAALASEAPAERLVAERAGGEEVGGLIGSVRLYAPGSDAYTGLAGPPSWPELRLLAVAPEARGLGVGQALVRECARRARAAGAATLGLHTSASMRVARGMYERMGFVRAPEYDFRPGEAELVEAYLLRLDG